MSFYQTPSRRSATANGAAIAEGDFVLVDGKLGIAMTDADDGADFEFVTDSAQWLANVPASTRAGDLLYIDDASSNPVTITRSVTSGGPIGRAFSDRDAAGRSQFLLFDAKPIVVPNLPAAPDADDIAAALVALGLATQVSAAATGTMQAGGVTEAAIVTGGQTIILTLTGGEFVTAFAGKRAAIIAGLVSDGVAAHGWAVDVAPAIPLSGVVRTSASVVTITLPAAAAYAIAEDETITVTIPAAAIANCAQDVVASPTLPITAS